MDRRARLLPGTKVEVISDKQSFGRYKNGDVLTVKKDMYEEDEILSHVFVEEYDIPLNDLEYKTLERG
ncbi:hypothetical protein [Virgibacillus halodenitrificans]|uniref:hypothetical protein n=1 Tax=Virgibacillus halodenitrificans TaxID=1482 RepID=UPI000EF4F447|nr:hypothetical protein [Virgibacillus halodenitrificans]